MWKVALGVMVFLQAGALRAAEDEAARSDVDVEESAVHVGCPPANEGSRAASNHDCDAEEVIVATPPRWPCRPRWRPPCRPRRLSRR